jgi:histidyl-tRNA synthetase
MLRERMTLAAELWAAGVRAELLHAAAPSLKEQYSAARSRGIAWLAIIEAATFSAAATVKVHACQMDIQTERQTDRQTERQAARRADRRT